MTNWNPFLDDTDNNGNVRRQVNYAPKPGGGGDVIPQLDDYTYDSLNRIGGLTEWQLDASGNWQPNVVTQNYSYDRYGNRCVASATGGVSNYCPTYTASNNRIGGLTYDAAGNTIQDLLTGGTMTYDGENRLLTATSGGGAIYAYDGEGKRVKRVAAGQTWWYVYGIGGELLAEYLSSAPTTARKEYGYRGGQLLVVWDGDKSGNEQLKWLVQDHLGSTRMEADKSGSLGGMRRHDYAPFGEEMYAGIRRNGGNGQYGYEPPQSSVRQRFGSKERDTETGLDYFLARYYSNNQGRFTGPDIPFADQFENDPQSWNLYAFVRNNPCANTDPNGRETCYYSNGSQIGCEGDKRINVDAKAGTLTVTPKKGAAPIVYDLNKVDAQFISRSGPPTPQDFMFEMGRRAQGTKELIGVAIGAGVVGGTGVGVGLYALGGGAGITTLGLSGAGAVSSPLVGSINTVTAGYRLTGVGELANGTLTLNIEGLGGQLVNSAGQAAGAGLRTLGKELIAAARATGAQTLEIHGLYVGKPGLAGAVAKVANSMGATFQQVSGNAFRIVINLR